MARRRRHDTKSYTPQNYSQRGHYASSTPVLLTRPLYRPLNVFDVMSSPIDILDFYQPRPAPRAVGGFSLSPSPVSRAQRSQTLDTTPAVFPAAGDLKTCVSRHQRREVLHALSLTGKGSRARFRRSRSTVKC